MRMKNIDDSSWQRMEDPPNEKGEFEAFHRAIEENQHQLNNPSTRGLNLDFDQVPHPVPDRSTKPTYRTEGMSRIAALSMLYGRYRFPTDDEINNNNNMQTCPPSYHNCFSEKHELSSKVNNKEYKNAPLKDKTKLLDKDKELPLLPKWQEEQRTPMPGYVQLNPNDPNTYHCSSAISRFPEGAMVRTVRFIANDPEDQDKLAARKSLKKDTGPENPFDDYYVLDSIEERELTRGNGVLFPVPELERREWDYERS